MLDYNIIGIMMRIILAISMLCVSTPLIGNTQTIDINTLSDRLKTVHRWAWCYEATQTRRDLPTAWVADLKLNEKLLMRTEALADHLYYKIGIVELMMDNTNVEKKDFVEKVRTDAKVQFLSEEVKLSNDVFKECSSDLKDMIKGNYVPNFQYMSN